MMPTSARHRLAAAAALGAALTFVPAALLAQRGGTGRGQESGPMHEATQLDLAGKTRQARTIFQAILDTVSAPAAKAGVERAIAISYAFDGDCANTLKYERMGIDYWKTRERADPQNAFYQEGELADEGARVCLDAGDLGAAEEWYRMGYRLGNEEPAPRTHPKSLWDFRLAHALGRIAARRGDKAEAQREIAAARRALDGDSTMAAQQERFYPYLVGYVAYYTGDLERAEAELSSALAMRGNQNDPFMTCLLAMTYEKMGDQAKADALYKKAYALADAHNPPSAFVRPFVRKKLGLGA